MGLFEHAVRLTYSGGGANINLEFPFERLRRKVKKGLRLRPALLILHVKFPGGGNLLDQNSHTAGDNQRTSNECFGSRKLMKHHYRDQLRHDEENRDV